MSYFIYICPLHIKEVDMNKKSNFSLICEGVKLKSKSQKSQKKETIKYVL